MTRDPGSHLVEHDRNGGGVGGGGGGDKINQNATNDSCKYSKRRLSMHPSEALDS